MIVVHPEGTPLDEGIAEVLAADECNRPDRLYVVDTLRRDYGVISGIPAERIETLAREVAFYLATGGDLDEMRRRSEERPS